MSAYAFITTEKLAELVADLIGSGTRVIAPITTDEGRATYSAIESLAEATFNQGLPMPSLKGHFLPPNEALLSWRQRGGDIELKPASSTFAPQIVLGARPCDVEALQIVDAVMNWDYHDDLWNGRRDATTIFALTCPGVDDSCFCTAVGSAPNSSRGSDALMTELPGGFLVEFTSEKGEAFLGEHERFFATAADEAVAAAATIGAEARTRIEQNLQIDTARVGRWIDGHFDDDFWPTLGPRCNGCGACASVCPTCHCFDINDEQTGVGTGVRRRNWDSCQAKKFTVHASGHNPRGDKDARYRQRIAHKFYIYPSKFGDVLCTGCGRCVRACPSNQDLVEILQTIDGLATVEEGGAA
jgi:ferredoxin